MDDRKGSITMSSLLQLTLSALKKRLADRPSIQIQQESGYVTEVRFLFNAPALEWELVKFEETNQLFLPKDYKEFLLMHNGAKLFIDEKSGASFEVLSISEIQEDHQSLDYPEGWYPIAYGLESSVLVMNLNEINPHKRSNEYLFWLEPGESIEHATPLSMNFEIFLERFIISQGVEYWNWPAYKARHFYKANDLED
ncbi:SMI1/KNR4 family protein [Anoxybacillus rupiensis]|uniref:SMI1/KNR4 family protein n=2 Tax=Bacillales TaxID=1385 RepID=A0ABT5W860_9BACL|nr:SMI1/KNR4 family protein [Anoxybacillus rupiensis]